MVVVEARRADDAVGRGDRWRRPDVAVGERLQHLGEDVGGRHRLCEEEVTEHGVRVLIHHHGHLRCEAAAPKAGELPRAAGVRGDIGGELEDGLIAMERDAGLEVVDLDRAGGGPVLDAVAAGDGDKLVSLDAAAALVVASDDELADKVAVAEPDLVLGEKPLGVVCGVEVAVTGERVGRCEGDAGGVLLDEGVPECVGDGVVSEKAAGGGYGCEIYGR